MQEGKKFRVVVMDSRPQLEGRPLLRRLLSHGIACTYVLLNAASYIMTEVTKVCMLELHIVPPALPPPTHATPQFTKALTHVAVQIEIMTV